VVYANYCGSEGDIHYCGLSSICAPDGTRLALAQQDEVLIWGTLDRQLMNESRSINTYFNDRRPGLYVGLVEE
jgi:predicted amidohydrolase